MDTKTDFFFPVQCPAGSSYDESVTPHVCKLCEVGTYQPKPGQKTCEKCPSDVTTETPGAVKPEDCRSKII